MKAEALVLPPSITMNPSHLLTTTRSKCTRCSKTRTNTKLVNCRPQTLFDRRGMSLIQDDGGLAERSKCTLLSGADVNNVEVHFDETPILYTLFSYPSSYCRPFGVPSATRFELRGSCTLHKDGSFHTHGEKPRHIQFLPQFLLLTTIRGIHLEAGSVGSLWSSN